jgi:hypothetical protein
MYNDQLEQKTLAINDLFLDPNNPRFWSEQTQKVADVPDPKIPDTAHQERALTRIANSHGLQDIRNSIDLPIMLRSGRQLAHGLSRRAGLRQWMAARDSVGTTAANLSKNLFGPMAAAV